MWEQPNKLLIFYFSIEHNHLKTYFHGVPAMVQCVKNLTAAAQVAAEVWVQFLAWCSGLKDLALLQPWHRSELWPGNLQMLWVWPSIFF